MSDLRSWLRTPSTTRDVTVLTLALALLFAVLGGHPPFGSSMRYAEAAREMVALNDWVVPHLHYAPYCEKPILTYWLAAGARWLFGPSFHSTHLPSALMGLVSVLSTWALARHLRSGGFALAAAMILVGSGMFLVMTSELTTDPILSGWMALAWLAFWRHQSDPTRYSPWWWTFWAALGLGVLSKGPIAVVLATAAIGGFALLDGGWRGMWRTLVVQRALRGLAVILAINLPWSLAMWQRDPRFLEFFYVRFNLEAFYSDEVNHTGSLFLYVGVLTAAFFPWSIQTMIACWQQLRTVFWPALRERWQDVPGNHANPRDDTARLRLYLLCVLLFPFLFLTISSSKLGTYLMPMYPAIAILLADALWNQRSPAPAWQRWSPLITVVALTLGALGAWPVLTWTQPEEAARMDWAWWPLLLLVGIALLGGHAWAAWNAWRGRILTGVVSAGLGTAVALALITPTVHLLIRDLTPTRLTELVTTFGTPSDPVVIDREVVQDYTLVYGLGRRAVIVGNTRESGMGHFAQMPARRGEPFPRQTYLINADNLPEHPWLCTWKRLVFALHSDTRIWVFGEDDLVRRLRDAGAPFTVVDRAANVVLLTNHVPPGLPVAASAGTP